MDNYRAARCYVRCMQKIDPDFDETEYLTELTERFKELPGKQIQMIYLDAALSYLRRNDIKQALKYFLNCFEIDPENKMLTVKKTCFKAFKGFILEKHS